MTEKEYNEKTEKQLFDEYADGWYYDQGYWFPPRRVNAFGAELTNNLSNGVIPCFVIS